MDTAAKEISQNIDWLKSHYYALLKRVEQLERERLTVAVSPGYGEITKEATGELIA